LFHRTHAAVGADPDAEKKETSSLDNQEKSLKLEMPESPGEGLFLEAGRVRPASGRRRGRLRGTGLLEVQTMNRPAFWIAVAVLCGAVGSARADVIYSNFGPGQSYSPGGYSVSGLTTLNALPPFGFGFAIAESFTPTSDFLFSSAELPLVWFSGPNEFTIDLMSDAGGHPGTVLESFSLTNAPPNTSPAVESFVSTTHTPLAAGATYWVVAIPGARDAAGFRLANTTGAGGFSRTGNDGMTWSTDPQASPALEVDGTPAPVPVPEPSSLVLLGLAGQVGWRGWRGRKKAAGAAA
jgi:hypothetical protein